MSDIIFTPHRARHRGGIRTLPCPPTGVLSTILIETPGVTFVRPGTHNKIHPGSGRLNIFGVYSDNIG